MSRTHETDRIQRFLPKLSIYAHFTPRSQMSGTGVKRLKATKFAPPVSTLPIDLSGGAGMINRMYGNDQYGDCGYAMSKHVVDLWTYGRGQAGWTQALDDTAALVAQYLLKEGGDNGCDEDDLVGSGGVWLAGLASNPLQIVSDHLDVDVTDVALTQYLMSQGWPIEMAWSVPDAFIQSFAQGTIYPSAMVPDPSNGHYTPLADCAAPGTIINGTDIGGYYRLWTWGAWCWVSPAFVASVQPQSFVAFGPQQFASSGYDCFAVHVSTRAAAWIALGGNASLANALVATFPPPSPTPTPTPSPTPAPAPSPTPTPGPAPGPTPVGAYGVSGYLLLSAPDSLAPPLRARQSMLSAARSRLFHERCLSAGVDWGVFVQLMDALLQDLFPADSRTA